VKWIIWQSKRIKLVPLGSNPFVLPLCSQRKTGRNVTHLNFKIDAKEAAPKAVKRPSLTRAYVEKHALPGESWEVARERLRAERGRVPFN